MGVLRNDAELRQRLMAIQKIVHDACMKHSRNPEEVLIVAVSKSQPFGLIEEAYSLGIRDFGESYVQELVEKASLVEKRGLKDIRFHFIGGLQSNKIKKLCAVKSLCWVHSLASEKHADRFAEAGRQGMKFLMQVDFTGKKGRSGVQPETAESLLEYSVSKGLDVRGLMTIPEQSQEPSHVFAKLRELRGSLQERAGGKLPELSMGMSSDFQIAIQEGSTIVRIGTALFGKRKAMHQPDATDSI